MTRKFVAGFIPLVDAACLLIAADFGFAETEGLEIQLVREVSWANVREKLSAGIFDAAHLLAPMAIASALDLMPGSTPLTAPYVLAMNGNGITVSEALFQDIMANLDDGSVPPSPLATARALARIVADRKRRRQPPLTFGTTFPFSCHTYQLRFWLAAGGIDTSEDVRIAVLPPPYMVESLKGGEVDGFCVGAPWNSRAVELGIGHIIHFGSEIVERLTEKVIAARSDWARHHGDLLISLMRSVSAAAAFASKPENWELCSERLSAPGRIDAGRDLIKQSLSGALKVDRAGSYRRDNGHLILGEGLKARPDTAQAAWFYSQMVRWKQASFEPGLLAKAQAVLSPDLFDLTFTVELEDRAALPAPPDGLGAFTGPRFDQQAIVEYLRSFEG